MKHFVKKTQFLVISATAAILMFPMVSFAATALSPAAPQGISETSVTLVAHVENPGHTVTVWFEWGETPALGRSAGMTALWGSGFPYVYLSSLQPGTTYYARVIAMEDGQRVESPVTSFVTRNSVVQKIATVSSSATPEPVVPVLQAPKKVTTTTTKAKPIAQVSAKKNVTSGANVEPVKPVTEGFQNQNMAAVFGFGDSIFPTTLIGWVLLIIAIFIIVLLINMIFKSIEERKQDEVPQEGEEVLEKKP